MNKNIVLPNMVDIFVNKKFEVEPFIDALQWLESKGLPSPVKKENMDGKKPGVPRLEYFINGNYFNVWCIEDLMDNGTSGSNSQEKFRVLPEYIRTDNPHLIISVSTAESTPDVQPEDTSLNGSVLMGEMFYQLDAQQYDPTSPSNLEAQPLAESFVQWQIYRLIQQCTPSINKLLVCPKHVGASRHALCCAASREFTSIGVINIVHYDAYAKADPAAYEAFKKENPDLVAASIETTHGIVKMSAAEAAGGKHRYPVLFVSPITDRYLHFDDDVDEAQNYTAGYNAGIAVGVLMENMTYSDLVSSPSPRFADSHTNAAHIWVKGEGISNVGYVLKEKKITTDQPWNSFHASSSKNNLLTFVVEAGRKGSSDVAEWFIEHSAAGMAGCDTCDAEPDNLNFAFTGEISFDYGGHTYTYGGYTFGQGHNARSRNNWWAGLASTAGQEIEIPCEGEEKAAISVKLFIKACGGTENEFELQITVLPANADI